MTSKSLGPLISKLPALDAEVWQLISTQDQTRLKLVSPVNGQEVEKETNREPDSVAVTWKG